MWGRGRESVILSLQTSYTESALVPNFWGSGHQQMGQGQMEGFEDTTAVRTPALTL